MKKLITSILVITCIACSHGQWKNSIKGNGNEVTVERETGDYDGVAIGSFFEAELVEGTEGKITITSEDNLLDYIETEVVNGILVIKAKDNKQLRPSSGNTVFISIPVKQIATIRLSGSGQVVGKMKFKAERFKVHTSGSKNGEFSIETNSFDVITSGSSHLILEGTSNQLNITSSGSSQLKAFELETDDLEIRSSGSSNIRITVNNSINSRSSGSSNVKYRGNPEIVTGHPSGSSKVSKE